MKSSRRKHILRLIVLVLLESAYYGIKVGNRKNPIKMRKDWGWAYRPLCNPFRISMGCHMESLNYIVVPI